MTFTGSDEDITRLPDTCFGITAADEVGYAIAQSLVLEIGGEPFRVREDARTLYHAALAHAGNHIVTVLADALDALAGRAVGAPNCWVNSSSTTNPAASPNGSSDRWPGRRWRTPCGVGRQRSPARSPAVTRPRWPSHLDALAASIRSSPRPTG